MIAEFTNYLADTQVIGVKFPPAIEDRHIMTGMFCRFDAGKGNLAGAANKQYAHGLNPIRHNIAPDNPRTAWAMGI
jgi:hypothetical protein